MYGYICGKAVRTNWTSCETILAEILGILHTTHVSMLLPFNTFAKTKTCRSMSHSISAQLLFASSYS